MNRNIFLQSLFLPGTSPCLLAKKLQVDMSESDNVWSLGHATLVINIAKLKSVSRSGAFSKKGDGTDKELRK